MLQKIFYIICLEQRKTKQNPKPPEMGTMTANPPRNPPQTPPATIIRRPQQPTADHRSSSKPQQQIHKSILQPNPTITHKTKNKSTKSTYHIWSAFKLHRHPTPPQPPLPYATATTVTHCDHHEHQIPRTQKKKKKKNQNIQTNPTASHAAATTATGDGWITAVEIDISRSGARERAARGGRVVRGGGGSGWLGRSWDGEKERDQRQ